MPCGNVMAGQSSRDRCGSSGNAGAGVGDRIGAELVIDVVRDGRRVSLPLAPAELIVELERPARFSP